MSILKSQVTVHHCGGSQADIQKSRGRTLETVGQSTVKIKRNACVHAQYSTFSTLRQSRAPNQEMATHTFCEEIFHRHAHRPICWSLLVTWLLYLSLYEVRGSSEPTLWFVSNRTDIWPVGPSHSCFSAFHDSLLYNGSSLLFPFVWILDGALPYLRPCMVVPPQLFYPECFATGLSVNPSPLLWIVPSVSPP